MLSMLSLLAADAKRPSWARWARTVVFARLEGVWHRPKRHFHRRDIHGMTPEQINLLIEAIEDPHDLCLMCIGLFCATRTSETFGLQWKSYGGDSLMIHSTAYEGELYRGQVKTGASRNAVPIPDDIVPIIEA